MSVDSCMLPVVADAVAPDGSVKSTEVVYEVSSFVAPPRSLSACGV